jgi:hypothetical protein
MMKARYRKKVDPVAALAMWDVGMDTYAISSIMGCLESDVYRVLARVMERRRHDQNHSGSSAQRQPALENDIDRRNVPVSKVHNLA